MSSIINTTEKGGNSSILSDNGRYYQMKQSRINESMMQPITETKEENSPAKQSENNSLIEESEVP